MIIGSWLRRSRAAADLILSGAIYDDRPFEAIPHYHIIVANFDYLLGNLAPHIFTFWDRLLYLLFPLHGIALQCRFLSGLLLNRSVRFIRPI
jgi:hypothetical protein